MHGFAPAAERTVQVFAILIGTVFLLSGVVYLYLGRVTCLWAGNFWSIYAFAWNHTWLQSAMLKQAGHVTFFPSCIGLANLRFFHGDVQMLFFVGLGLLFITVSLLLVPVWRDKTVSLTAKTLATLVVLMGNFWMGRASITADGEFNCDNSLATAGAALAFLLITKTRCSWAVTAIVVCAGFLASFSFGTGLAIWPSLLLLAWCMRLPRRTIVLLGISALAAAIIYEELPVLPTSYGVQKESEVSLTPMRVLTEFCRLVSSPVLHTLAAWCGPKTLTDLSQSFSIALAGVAGLTLAGIAVIPRMLRRDLGKGGLESTGMSLLIFTVFALALITVGRLRSFNLVPFAPRYLFWSSLFWTSLILLGIERAERLQWGRWPTLLLPFVIAIFAWPAHYQAWFWCKNAQILHDKDATALINGAVETQRIQMVPPQFKQIFEDRLHLASKLRARRLDVFAAGLQDWIGLREADVFGARHRTEGLHGQCSIDALGHCDNGAPAARVSGQAFKHEQSIPWTLVITDLNGVIRGVARSARISPFVNRTFYQSKFTAKIGFVGYIRDYNPELRYVVRSADNLTLSDEVIPVQH
ncbi:MAG: hypothetical protein DME51_02765 [Verrucomicrobia bacterium]|nr:MAG: hypothetical protein DME51_02765 [Verrucomicrobiota bacterium]